MTSSFHPNSTNITQNRAYRMPTRTTATPVSQDLNGPVESIYEDPVVVTSVAEFCFWFFLRVGLSVVIITLYLYLAMYVSELYMVGMIAAVGAGLMVQGYMRMKSVRDLQERYLVNDKERIQSAIATVIDRYTDGWEPGLLALGTPVECQTQFGTSSSSLSSSSVPQHTSQDAAPPSRHPTSPKPTNPPKVKFAGVDEEDPEQIVAYRQPQAVKRATKRATFESFDSDPDAYYHRYQYEASAGSIHTIVVQYRARVPAGYKRSDGHIMETDNVDAIVVREFKQVHPDLYYYDDHQERMMPGDDNIHSSAAAATIEILYPTHEPKAGYPQALLEEYAPQHQNGRIIIGTIVMLVSILLMSQMVPFFTTVNCVAFVSNTVLLVTVSGVIYRRAIDKHHALLRGGGARITGWLPRQQQVMVVPPINTGAGTTAAPKEPGVTANSGLPPPHEQPPLEPERQQPEGAAKTTKSKRSRRASSPHVRRYRYEEEKKDFPMAEPPSILSTRAPDDMSYPYHHSRPKNISNINNISKSKEGIQLGPVDSYGSLKENSIYAC